MTFRLLAGMLAGALLAGNAIAPASAAPPPWVDTVDAPATPAFALQRVIGQCEVQHVVLPWKKLHASVKPSTDTFYYGKRKIYEITFSQILPDGTFKPLVRAAMTIKERQLLWCQDLRTPRAKPLWK